jgi:hypothetical protein
MRRHYSPGLTPNRRLVPTASRGGVHFRLRLNLYNALGVFFRPSVNEALANPLDGGLALNPLLHGYQFTYLE